MIGLDKQFTSMHKWKTKDTPTEGLKLMQHIQHMDHMESEVSRLLPKLPAHKYMGIAQSDKLRLMAAAKHA